MRVAELCRHVESKVARVLDGAVPEANAIDACLLEHLLQEQRLKSRVQFLADVFQQHRKAKLDRILEHSNVLTPPCELYNLHFGPCEQQSSFVILDTLIL